MTKTPKNTPPSPTLETPETDRLVGSNPTDGLAPAISPGYLAESRRSRRGGESRPKSDENGRRDTGETPPEAAPVEAPIDAEAALRHALSTPGVNGVISPDARDRVKVDDVARYEIGDAYDEGREVVEIDRVAGVVTLAPAGTLVTLGDPVVRAAPSLKARIRAGFREYALGSGWVRSPDVAEIRSNWGELGRGEYLLTQAEADLPDVESPEVAAADDRALAAARDFGDAWQMAHDSPGSAEAEAAGRLQARCLTRWHRALAAADMEAHRRA